MTDKRPTPKQVREHYKKCRRLFYLLQVALNEAHNRNVINYGRRKNEQGFWIDDLPSVCEAVSEAKDRFEVATKTQLANAMKEELMKELKGIW